jgi:GNAT superfamily N-acetyltransferase
MRRATMNPRNETSFDAAAVSIRTGLRSGDLGWVAHRHGVLYAEEYDWNVEFEALVASVVADFGKQHDPAREQCWFAEIDGQMVGSIFLVQHSENIGQLRLMLVEPSARGRGIGTRLINECLAFARAAGYQTVKLWTNSVLVDARRLYARAGFRLVESEPYHAFGHELVSEFWEIEV